ncbi:long-chain-fatty-acid--CoA ligase [Virgisporangium aliadipatigenens]|uniref:Acyl-CoA synthetase n=1 Tax=Virgisporangium aliadipatigenens TaxID=741659 RepID=A0A8J4DTH6_9ACTN|nr:long-chain fatty acid--CoA ligase [Virgisporangium aliadipatigenens]GIJ50200.1 long-chain-fatty-acid--CoA ligase [Virgisporangium aliadipatigenens]
MDETAAAATIASRVRDHARRAPDRVCLRRRGDTGWDDITWARYWDVAEEVAQAFLAVGVEPGDRIAVHADNRPEWLYADTGAVAVRAVTVGLYPTSPPAEIRHLLAHSGAKVLVTENRTQLEKALAVLDDCPELTHIVCLDPEGIPAEHPKVQTWDGFLALGREHRAAHADAVAARMAAARADDLVTIVYTSGTTGPPKGAMLSVANVEFLTELMAAGGSIRPPAPGPADVTLSYLPLCHVAERYMSVWLNASSGVTVHFGESLATFARDLREVQPTIFFAVPRVWERMRAGVLAATGAAPPLLRRHGRLWLGVAERVGARMAANGGRHTFGTRVLSGIGRAVLYRTLRERLGLSRVRHASSGAAPIAPEVLEFFLGIGITVQEVYGMTENSAVATINRPDRVRIGTVGEPHDGIDLRIDEETGEIQTRHRGTFVGYFREPEATAAAFTEDGYLRTGDLGEWVDGTHVRIIGRARDIIVTAGGKNIAPAGIEQALVASPFLRDALLVGDRRPYVTALIGIEPEAVGRAVGVPGASCAELVDRPDVVALVQSVVDEVNADLANVERVKRFALLPKELAHADGELTATLKVRRATVVDAYATLVDGLYLG